MGRRWCQIGHDYWVFSCAFRSWEDPAGFGLSLSDSPHKNYSWLEFTYFPSGTTKHRLDTSELSIPMNLEIPIFGIWDGPALKTNGDIWWLCSIKSHDAQLLRGKSTWDMYGSLSNPWNFPDLQNCKQIETELNSPFFWAWIPGILLKVCSNIENIGK